jgi:hypothetical protein
MTDLLEAHALLVVPSDDLRGMLDEGPCGARPPHALHCECGHWYAGPGTGGVACPTCGEHWGSSDEQALVLRWQGEDLPHGWLAAGLGIERLIDAGYTLVALDKQGKEMTDD